MTAGLETLKILKESGVFESIAARAEKLGRGIGAAAQKAGAPVYQTRVGTMFCTYFTPSPAVDWDTAAQADTETFTRFFNAMLQQGVYLAPSQFEAGFMSLAHTDEVIEETIAAAERAFAILAG